MRKCFVLVAFFAAIATASSTAPVNFPSYIKPCRARDSGCLKKLLEELVPFLVQGIPEFNLPSIDPWNVPNFNQSDDHSPELTYSATVTDMKYRGLSNFNVLNFDVDLDRSKFDLKLFFPQVVITAHEVVSGVGFGIHVNGNGLTTATFSNLTIGFSLKAKETSIEEKVYLKWKEDAVTVSFDGAGYELDASFVDGENYKKVLDLGNQKYPQLFNPQMQKSIRITLGEFVLQTINYVHGTYPVDVLYLAP